MAGETVVEGAVLSCPMGDAPATLIVTSQTVKTIDGLAVATVEDCSPIVNIPSFGTCSVLTAAATGVPTPCVPVPTGCWTPGSLVQTIDGLPVLTMPATVTCGVGGCISVLEAEQVLEESE